MVTGSIYNPADVQRIVRTFQPILFLRMRRVFSSAYEALSQFMIIPVIRACNMDTKPWFDQIDATTASFKESFQNLSADELNWKPNGKTWSVAQNIHHLIVINQTYYSVIKKVR